MGGQFGFEPVWMPDFLFDFQKYNVDWQLRKGRGATFADCGTGKMLMELVWAQNVVMKTNGRVLVVTPLSVGLQLQAEGVKFGVETFRSRDGSFPATAKIIITNYEKLHLFNPNDFVGVAGDESSIIKHATGATQKQFTRFLCKMPYRSLWTATPSPNDYIELGTSSEALGELSYSDMLTRFFKQLDDKGQKQEARQQAANEKAAKHFARLSFRVSQTINQWRLKHHAIIPFWQWVCSWARAWRKPSDLGFPDGKFILPPLIERHHTIQPKSAPEGYLLTLPALGLKEEREERKRTMTERCEFVTKLVNHKEPALIWCQMNNEGNRLEKMIPNCRQVAGCTPDEEREEIVKWFLEGGDRKLISKARVFGFGLNFQHCAHVVTFATHSYEQFYQSVRRCWRFGQTRPVILDIVATEGESGVRANMMRKADQAAKMFELLVTHMNAAQRIERTNRHTNKITIPNWI